MKRAKRINMFSLVMAGLMVLGMTSAALAAGTTSGTDISNTATITYQVGAVPQTAIESSPVGNSTPGAGSGTPTIFKVDNKIDLTVSEVNGSYTDVIPNAQDQVLVFTVTNDGNTTQDFAVTALASGTDPHGGADNFDAANLQVFVDVNANGTYEPATDTAIFVDELGEDASVTVFVLADIPAIQASGDIAAYTLTARAHDAGVAGTLGPLTNETAGADTAGVDVVFADAGGDTDAARDASFSDTDAFRVSSAQLSIQKTATVIRDPFNLDTNPKNIPGAYIQYAITVSNAATASNSATLTTITDALDANTAIDLDLIDAASGAPENAAAYGFKVEQVSSRPSAAGTQYFTTTTTVDGIDHDGSATGGNITATLASVLPAEGIAPNDYDAGELKPGESVTITFNVIIQ